MYNLLMNFPYTVKSSTNYYEVMDRSIEYGDIHTATYNMYKNRIAVEKSQKRINKYRKAQQKIKEEYPEYFL